MKKAARIIIFIIIGSLSIFMAYIFFISTYSSSFSKHKEKREIKRSYSNKSLNVKKDYKAVSDKIDKPKRIKDDKRPNNEVMQSGYSQTKEVEVKKNRNETIYLAMISAKEAIEGIDFTLRPQIDKKYDTILTISLKECKTFPTVSYIKLCAHCHGIYGENSALSVTKPVRLMSAKEIYKKLKQYQNGQLDQYGKGHVMTSKVKTLSDCELKSLANQIKGL